MLTPIILKLDSAWYNRAPFERKCFSNGFTRSWTNNANGIASNKKYWFLATEECIYKFQSDDSFSWIATKPLAKFSVETIANDPKFAGYGFNHFGDIDCDEAGNIWIPVEGNAGKHCIFVLSENFEILGVVEMPFQTFLSWCAVKGGFIYSCNFNDDKIYRYTADINSIKILPERELHLSIPLKRIQGGTFSDQGKLYLAIDGDDCTEIVSVDEIGKVSNECFIAARPFTLKEKVVNYVANDIIARYNELQGIHWRDNKLHVLLLEKKPIVNDHLIMLHYQDK